MKKYFKNMTNHKIAILISLLINIIFYFPMLIKGIKYNEYDWWDLILPILRNLKTLLLGFVIAEVIMFIIFIFKNVIRSKKNIINNVSESSSNKKSYFKNVTNHKIAILISILMNIIFYFPMLIKGIKYDEYGWWNLILPIHYNFGTLLLGFVIVEIIMFILYMIKLKKSIKKRI